MSWLSSIASSLSARTRPRMRQANPPPPRLQPGATSGAGLWIMLGGWRVRSARLTPTERRSAALRLAACAELGERGCLGSPREGLDPDSGVRPHSHAVRGPAPAKPWPSIRARTRQYPSPKCHWTRLLPKPRRHRPRSQTSGSRWRGRIFWVHGCDP